MPTPAPKPAPSTPCHPGRAVPVSPALQHQAVGVLLGAGSSVPPESVERFIHQAPSLGIDLGLAAAVVEPGPSPATVRQVCLPVLGAGRTIVLFLSGGGARDIPPAQHRADRVEAITHALRLAKDRHPGGVHLVQGLVEPREIWAAEAYESAGLRRLAELLYLSRPLRLGEAQRGVRAGAQINPPPGEAWPAGVFVRPMTATEPAAAALYTALIASYEKTLDCPELAGLRTTEDIVSAHRSVGAHDPGLWWIIEHAGEPAGCVLLNQCPAQGCVELVYIGLSPVVRGLGLGQLLMRCAIGAAATLEREMRCAVDARNEPARRMYQRLGFRETERRIAFVGLVKDLLARKC